MKKHKFSGVTVEHLEDGSGTVHFHHENGPDSDVKKGFLDLDGLHDHIEDHLRDPEEIEEALEKKGIDPEKLEEAISPGIHDKMAELLEEEK